MDLGFESKRIFYSLLIFCPLYQHIFADPDLGCQNVADPSDPDPEQAASKDTDTDCFIPI